ncbi:3-deoxy-D-manno-octulosonic acid transferase [Bordetella sp. H567]|uniref:3-deoxy-D-manno-octulosonic acid transferase n=1 Tax=Bordetella sp. H567 TaxID=1697043 RepID=UPI00081C4D43|nr:3-deoxy-D-manno-octulosonic acid transferase [Bordetella sp. H567]AOB33095.1 3-deoxy-D-manno-octulosonic acid transferase [Bordetella sp. H567]
MTRFLYTVLLRLFAPILWLWIHGRAGKSSGEWDILGPARFGRYADSEAGPRTKGRIWIHAVSLGETRAAQPLIRALLDEGRQVLLTHTTPTGRAEGGRLFPDAIANGQLRQAWLPYDFPGSVRRFLRFFAPRCGILIEREVWPNLIKEAGRQGVSMLLVSARLSERSVRRSRWARGALRRAYAALDLVLAQTKADAERLRQVGAYCPHVVGNLKFDVALSADQLEEGRAWRRTVGRAIVAIASTREGEDEIFATLIRNAINGRKGAAPLYMLIPRHPQRFAEAAALLEKNNVRFVRRSGGTQVPPADVPVLLGDTLGEMAFYYGAADVAIVGGGFEPLGGQNFIEACAAGTPVVVGPHMHNFAQATEDATAAGAALQVPDASEAMRIASTLLHDEPRRMAMRDAALGWTASHTGATGRMLQLLRPWVGA